MSGQNTSPQEALEEFQIGSFANHGNFWGAAAILLRKDRQIPFGAANLAQQLRNRGCSDNIGPDGPEILISWGGGPAEWVGIRDFPARYREWDPES